MLKHFRVGISTNASLLKNVTLFSSLLTYSLTQKHPNPPSAHTWANETGESTPKDSLPPHLGHYSENGIPFANHMQIPPLFECFCTHILSANIHASPTEPSLHCFTRSFTCARPTTPLTPKKTTEILLLSTLAIPPKRPDTFSAIQYRKQV